MIILNLGCGFKTSEHTLNLDYSMYLRFKKSRILTYLSKFILDKRQQERLSKLSSSVMLHDLRNTLPFEDDSVDVVYHSHFLEHLSPNHAHTFLMDNYRVLKPSGILRVSVPDLEHLCRKYLNHIQKCEESEEEIPQHDAYIASLIEQMVREESVAVKQKKNLHRLINKWALGDAKNRGEKHLWMYDRFNLKSLLQQIGFQEVHQQQYNTSLIPNWNEIGLDLDEHGNQYKPESLYVEAVK